MGTEQSNLPHGLELRPVIIPDDEEFLRSLYFSTREDLAFLPLEAAQKQAFIQMQYTAQRNQYRVQYSGADHQLILVNGVPAGRLLVQRRPTSIYLVDISLLPEHRGMKFGTAILSDLVEEVDTTGAAMGLHVLKTNPAARLYLRMGLTVIVDDGLYFEMRKAPNSR